jgi:hypothetical protein
MFLKLTNASGSTIRIKGYPIAPGDSIITENYTPEIEAADLAGDLTIETVNSMGSDGDVTQDVRLIANTTPVNSDNPLPVTAGRVQLVSAATMTRPANTTAYTAGDLIANNTTAGSVVPMEFVIGNAASGMIRRVRLCTNHTSGGTTNAMFRLHLYRALPTPANGDNLAFSTNQAAAYLGAFDVILDRQFTDGAAGNGSPLTGSEIGFQLPDGTTSLYGLLEARAAYTPTSSEQISVALEVLKDAV